MNIKVNLPEDMDEFQERLCKVMAQFLVDKYGCEKVRQALDVLKQEDHNKNKVCSWHLIQFLIKSKRSESY